MLQTTKEAIDTELRAGDAVFASLRADNTLIKDGLVALAFVSLRIAEAVNVPGVEREKMEGIIRDLAHRNGNTEPRMV